MERIIFRLKVIGACSIVVILSVALLVYVYFQGGGHSRFYDPVIGAVIAADSGLGGYLFWMLRKQYISLRRARLIVENHLLHIPAVITEGEYNLDIFFSPFGILIADRVIPFDAGMKSLRAMEMVNGKATITYGCSAGEKSISITGLPIQGFGLEELAEKLKYETGVTLNSLK